ncbi:hypothetical protein K1719_041441 [Acacia pycnantha]|nr:hypothetical protein K1719_041441 [Acacia pycnantha]
MNVARNFDIFVFFREFGTLENGIALSECDRYRRLLRTVCGISVQVLNILIQKPPFRPAKDDTKPVLQDPILRSDPIETEEAVLRLPPVSIARSTSPSKMI